MIRIQKFYDMVNPHQHGNTTPTSPNEEQTPMKSKEEKRANHIDKILNEANGSWKDIAEESYDIGYNEAIESYASQFKGNDAVDNGWMDCLKKDISELEQIEGELIETKNITIGKLTLTSLKFKNGNCYWIQLSKQSKVSLG